MSSEIRNIQATRVVRAALALACAAVVCAALAACGSSAKSSSSASKSVSNVSKTGTAATAHGFARFAALRECLAKNGVKWPQRPGGGRGPDRLLLRRPGGGRGPGSLFLRRGAGAPGGPGGPGVPGGAPLAGAAQPAGRAPFLAGPDSKMQAALKKCAPAGLRTFRARFGHLHARLTSPAFKQALTKFVACMSSNGVKLPAPDTSGKGPVFDTTHVNTASAQFRSAQQKCRRLLGAIGSPGGPPVPAGGPPAGGPPAEAVVPPDEAK